MRPDRAWGLSKRPARARVVGVALCAAAAWGAGPAADSTPERTPQLARETLATARPAREPRGRSPSNPVLAETRALLGPLFGAHRTEHFVILTDAEPGVALAHGRLMERAREEFHRFAREHRLSLREPDHRLVSILFASRADYASFARTRDGVDSSWIAGYYSIPANRIVFYDAGLLTPPPDPQGGQAAHEGSGAPARQGARALGRSEAGASWRADLRRRHAIDRTIHETIHLLAFNTGLQSPETRYPLWVSEGLALSFEPGSTRIGGLNRPAPHAGNPASVPSTGLGRDRLYRSLRAEGELLSWRRVISAERVPDHPAAVQAFYAQSSVLFRHLARYHPESFRAYLLHLDDRSADVSHEAFFEHSFGPVDDIAAEIERP